MKPTVSIGVLLALVVGCGSAQQTSDAGSNESDTGAADVLDSTQSDDGVETETDESIAADVADVPIESPAIEAGGSDTDVVGSVDVDAAAVDGGFDGSDLGSDAMDSAPSPDSPAADSSADITLPTLRPCIAADVTTGSRWHTCARKSDGTAWCWGLNDHGQIGTGDLLPQLLPIQVASLGTSVAQIAAGGWHSCALKTDGTLWCWGRNDLGQLGDGTPTERLLPVQVAQLGNEVAEVRAGYQHTCARKIDGTVWCWGWNIYGALGDGTNDGSVLPGQVSSLGNGVQSISAGAFHNCAIKTDQTVWCWGYGGNGQIGDGSKTDRLTAVQVTNLGGPATAVSAGNVHTCARRADATMWCWGNNDLGAIGDGSATTRPSPANVYTLSTHVATFAAGDESTCAILDDSSLWCWGGNTYGELGDGTTTAKYAPTAVGGITDAAGVAIGWQICARRQNGSISCWGRNAEGQIGDGTTIERDSPTPVLGCQ